MGAETSVLGACLLSAQALADVLPILLAEDFYKPAHQYVFDAMLTLYAKGVHVDAVSVAGLLTDASVFDDIGGTGLLLDLQMTTPAISSAKSYAERVVRMSRLRAAISATSEVLDAVYDGKDPDVVVDLLASLADDRRLVPREISLPADYQRAAEFRAMLDQEIEGGEWIVPSILRKMWRALVVGAEGGGKSTIFRQMATLVANGMHPFSSGYHKITPRRCLVIDAENPVDIIQDQFDLIDECAGMPLSHSENLWIWRLEGGINLRERTAQMHMERILQDCQPEFVTMGPVYKMYANGKTDMEQSANEFLSVIDNFRKRFGFAVMIEHHAPKGSNGERDIVPFGSSTWLRWPEFGIRLRGMDLDAQMRPHKILVGRFRGDRPNAQWPTILHRDRKQSMIPWVGEWPTGTFRDPSAKRPEPPSVGDSDRRDGGS